MNILVITEKQHVSDNQRDGGSRVIEMLTSIDSAEVKVLDFSVKGDNSKSSSLVYPFHDDCRFERRLLNKEFISETVRKHLPWSDIVIFVHCSMMFGCEHKDLIDTRSILFPMFTSKSYLQSGEIVPQSYLREEQRILQLADGIITPSNLEKKMMVEIGIQEQKITVISRGVQADAKHLIRKLNSEQTLNCVCLGSIKPQKNPIETLLIFEEIAKARPNSKLTFIGPIQCKDTYEDLISEIKKSEFSNLITIKKPVKPDDLYENLKKYHVHISTSRCETFGRAIIETSVMGIPNIMFRSFNAAAALLEHRIGAHVIEDIAEFDAVKWLNEISLETKSLSLVGLSDIFDINIERKRVIASITEDFTTVVSDFDGTIFHKESPELTSEWVSRISKFDCVILCSARGIDSLLALSNKIGLRWDAIVSYSGALLTTKKGDHRIISEMKSVPNGCSEIRFEQYLIQAKFESNPAIFSGEFRQESYSDTVYWLPWKTTKLRGALLAISHFSKVGGVVAFGDGENDIPLIQFFGGKVVKDGLPADNEVKDP